MGISDFKISGQYLLNENYDNSRASDDINMKLRPITKLDKKNKTTPKKNLTIRLCRENVMSLSFFEFMANLEQLASRILEAQSLKLTFSLIVTFYLTKTENRTKKSLTQLSHCRFEQGYYFCQKLLILCKKMLTSAKLRES